MSATVSPQQTPSAPPTLTKATSTKAKSANLSQPQQVQTQPTVPETTPEFERQVDKLADLLPHADRAVLAGYLRRAGQDVLAIGQDLEDEKNGALRHD